MCRVSIKRETTDDVVNLIDDVNVGLSYDTTGFGKLICLQESGAGEV